MILRIRRVLHSALLYGERLLRTDIAYLASGGTWLLVGQACALLLSLSLAVLFGHFATQDTYGNYKFILSVGGLLALFGLSGIGTAVTRSVAKGYEGALSQGSRLSLRYAGGVALAGLCASLYYIYTGNTFAAAGMALSAIALPLISSWSLYSAFLTGAQRFKQDALYSTASLAFTVAAIGITLLLFSDRAIVLVSVYLIVTVLSSALWYYASIRTCRNASEDPELLKYGFHLSLMGFVSAVADKIDSIIIFSFLGPTQLAVYSYAIAIPEQIKAVVKSLVPLSMPRFAKRTLGEIDDTIWYRIGMLLILVAIPLGAYMVAAPLLFKTLFPVYVESVPFSQLYALSILFTCITAPLISVLQAHKQTRGLYISTNVGSVALLAVLPIMAYYWGIQGAILAQIVYRAVNALVTVWQFVTASRTTTAA